MPLLYEEPERGAIRFRDIRSDARDADGEESARGGTNLADASERGENERVRMTGRERKNKRFRGYRS
jgi:hypothetical protein